MKVLTTTYSKTPKQVSKTVTPKEDNHFEEKISFIKDGDVDPKNAKYD